MKVTSVTLAFVAAAGMAAFAQATQQNPTTTQQPSSQQPSTQTQPATPRTTAGAAGQQGQQVTITGCIVSEADYRRAQGAGAGGAVSSGAGVGNEFILTNASMSTAGSAGSAGGATAGAAGATPSGGATAGAGGATASGTVAGGTRAGGATGTSGTASASSSMSFELTGPAEGQAAQHVGRRVEITGMLKDAATAGGPTANVPGSRDLKLREVEVSAVRAATGGAPCN